MSLFVSPFRLLSSSFISWQRPYGLTVELFIIFCWPVVLLFSLTFSLKMMQFWTSSAKDDAVLELFGVLFVSIGTWYVFWNHVSLKIPNRFQMKCNQSRPRSWLHIHKASNTNQVNKNVDLFIIFCWPNVLLFSLTFLIKMMQF